MNKKDCYDVSLQNNAPIETFAFDGCHFYFLLPQCKKIIKTNLQCKEIKCYQFSVPYTCLCYDFDDCCFYAYSPNTPDCIVKFNCNMEIIAKQTLCKKCIGRNRITSLSYNCCHKSLVISTPDKIVEINKTTSKCITSYSPHIGIITSVYTFAPFYLIWSCNGGIYTLYGLTYSGRICKLYSLNLNGKILGMVFEICHNETINSSFKILVANHPCSYEICTLPLSQLSSLKNACPCNYKTKCCQTPPFPPKPAPIPHCNIIESIALEEAALAHILNAEGEKLQKVIALSNDINTILCVNREVNETIINVTNLEQILYSKLLSANKCCCSHKESCK